MRLSELQSKNIVNINDGKNVGTIIDASIGNDGVIDTLVIETNKNLFSLSRESDIEVKWKDITKIGQDVILVKIGQNE